MKFMSDIIDFLWTISEWFYDAYLTVRDWPFGLDILAAPLYAIRWQFRWLAEAFYDFFEWLEWAAGMIGEILSWSSIRSLIRSWLPGLEDALAWFLSWTTWVGQYINDWWTGILPYILTYVDNAVEDINTLIAGWNDFWTVTWPQWVSLFDELKSSWDNFVNTVLTNLVSFTWLTTWWNSKLLDINALIDSWFKELLPFFEGWQEIRDQVFEFFSDPWGYLIGKFTDWFLGPEG